jgi:hypothetical protein
MKRIALALLFLLPVAVFADGPEPITIGETVTLRSEILDEERTPGERSTSWSRTASCPP